MVWQYSSNERQPTFLSRMFGPIILSVLILATAWLSGGKYLLIRQLWMDEVHSWLIVTDAQHSHAMNALADGVDFNPPAWFLVTRWMTAVSESVTEMQLRLLSMMWMLLALCGLYLLLSRHFEPRVCLTAVLLTASHPLMIHHATEIRFYGFWCACVVWLCHVIGWTPSTASMLRLRLILVSVLSMLTTTCHYFGIFSVFLVVLPLIFRRTRDKETIRLVAMAWLTGAAGLASCGHFLAGQKAALSRPTWISPTTLLDTLLYLQVLFPGWQILVCTAGLTFSVISSRRLSLRELFGKICSVAASFQPCLCLAGMPLMIVLVAWCIQPALVTRYAIVGIVGLAPLLASALSLCSRRIQHLLSIVSLLGLAFAVNNCADQWIREDVERSAVIKKLKECPTDAWIVFEDRILWMPVLHQQPELMSRCMLVDFANDEMAEDSTLRIVQRDVGRRIQKWYPQYGLLPIRMLSEQPMFFVVPYAGRSTVGLTYPPDHIATRESEVLVRFQRAKYASVESQSVVVRPEDAAVETRTTQRVRENLLNCF